MEVLSGNWGGTDFLQGVIILTFCSVCACVRRGGGSVLREGAERGL